jgi:hypothetical protein
MPTDAESVARGLIEAFGAIDLGRMRLLRGEMVEALPAASDAFWSA